MRIWRERGLALTLAESHIFVVAWEWVDRRGQRKWLFDYTSSNPTRYRSRFFLCKPHMKPLTYSFSGNKYFFHQYKSSSDLPKLSTTSSKISKFWFSKLFFIIENQWHLKKTMKSERPSFLKWAQFFSALLMTFGKSHDDLRQRKNTYLHYLQMWFKKSWTVPRYH